MCAVGEVPLVAAGVLKRIGGGRVVYVGWSPKEQSLYVTW